MYIFQPMRINFIKFCLICVLSPHSYTLAILFTVQESTEMVLMAAEEVLELYDYYWFDIDIFNNKQAIPETISVDCQHQEPSLSPSAQTRSPSLHCLCSDTSFSLSSQSPVSVIVVTELETVLPGKEAKEDVEIPIRRKKLEKKQRSKKGSRSLTELQVEELKGFMDLGFVFSEEDKDSRLVSIIPGLQRYRKEGNGDTVSRPYLSEAWVVLDQTKVTNQLIDWRLRIPNGEIDMKELLRVWAQSVASTVK